MTAFTILAKFVIRFRGQMYIGCILVTMTPVGMMRIEGEEECIEWWVGHMSIVTRRWLAPICQIIRTMAAQCQWQHNAAMPLISQEIRPSFPSHQVSGKNMLISMP